MINPGRPMVYDQAQARDYDYLSGLRFDMIARAAMMADLLGSTSTIVCGLAATPDSPADLGIKLAAGDIYQQANVDTAAYGSLPADTTQIMQQGMAAAQTVLLSTAGLSSGQSRWALIQAQFNQNDVIPSDDPNGGLLAYLNANNPSGAPWSGANNSGVPQNTRRMGVCSIGVIYGTVATTGSEVPPNPSSGWVPLYLIDLTFSQTQITAGEILIAGPSVGTGVPTNYPVAPFFYGFATLSQPPVRAGLKISNDGVSPNTKRNITAILLSVSGSGQSALLANVNVSINSAVSGAGGLDVGTLSASAAYFEYVISGPGVSPAGIMSLSSTGPSFANASGYSMWTRVGGGAITDPSKNFYRIKQVGDIAQYVVTPATNTAAMPQIASGTTSGYQAVSLASYVPATAMAANLALFGGDFASGGAMVAPNANYGTSPGSNPPPMNVSGDTGSVTAVVLGMLLLESASVYYNASGSSMAVAPSLNVFGWRDGF